ncbi:hypothetical protein NW754_006146 [Fusarium falciforme]|nr:hypothetical protein NW754_006146 [Fusarium falciforme]
MECQFILTGSWKRHILLGLTLKTGAVSILMAAAVHGFTIGAKSRPSSGSAPTSAPFKDPFILPDPAICLQRHTTFPSTHELLHDDIVAATIVADRHSSGHVRATRR